MRVVDHPDRLPGTLDRVAVIGTSGCGKSFLARELSARTGAPHVELDALNWNDNWTQTPEDEFRRRFHDAIAAPRWILDGNYARDGLQRAAFAAADLVFWLDLPFRTVMRRIVVRSVRRAATRERLWGTNNRESFRLLLTSKYSMPLWVVKTFHSRRRMYEGRFTPGAFPETALVRVRASADTMRWLEAIARVMGEG